MPISNLPPTVFNRITHALVDSSSIAKALQYRQVCRAFARSILKDLSTRVSRLSFTQIFTKASYTKLFDLYSGLILSKKALRSRSPESPVLQLVHDIVAWILSRRSQTGQDIRHHRLRYTERTCDAIMALDKKTLQKLLTRKSISQPSTSKKLLPGIMLAVAAAIGDGDFIRERTSKPSDLYAAQCEWFPDAIAASVACGQTQILHSMLEYLEKNVKGKPEADSWRPMRAAAHAIGQSLRTAIRLHKTEAANVIFVFLASNETFNRSTSLWLGERLCKDCLRYGNADLMYAAFAYERTGSYDPRNTDHSKKFSISKYELDFLLNHGHWTALQILIKNDLLDPGAPLVEYALDSRDRFVQAASTLLDSGANAKSPAENLNGKTVLWHVAKGGHYAHVKVLLLHGAEPDHPDPQFSPLEVAKKEHHNRCSFYLRMVKEHGKEYMNRPDLEQLYDADNEERHRGDSNWWQHNTPWPIRNRMLGMPVLQV